MRVPSYIVSSVTLTILMIVVVASILVTSPNNSEPDATEALWTSPENLRDNWSIIWSSLVTIFICTWTIFHPDIEINNTFVSPRVQWFFVGVFAPEFVAVMAMAQFLRIWALRRQVMRHSSSRDSGLQHWSWMQYFYADMGGFVIKRERSSTQRLYDRSRPIQLSLRSIVQLCDNGYSDSFNVSIEEIRDRSKGDTLAKVITVCQVLWFLAQVIGRAISKLPVTTMELVTVAYVATSTFTMLFWWNKPLGINLPTVVNIQPGDLDPEFVTTMPELETLHQPDSLGIPLLEWTGISKSTALKESFKQQVSSVSVPVQVDSRVGPYIHFFVVTLLSVVFGLVHLLAYITGFYFASYTEQVLWFASSLGSTIAPPCLYILYYTPMQHDKPSRISSILRYFVLLITGAAYIVFRLYLLVEPFYGLRKVEVGVYEPVRWAQYWPHVH